MGDAVATRDVPTMSRRVLGRVAVTASATTALATGYRGTWPGLVNSLDADLAVTTDYRSVLSELVDKRLGRSVATVFPGFAPEAVGAVG